MAGGGVAPSGVAKERADQYRGRVTPFVVTACVVAAVGGAIFGYDIGISGTQILSLLSPSLFNLFSVYFVKKDRSKFFFLANFRGIYVILEITYIL